MSDPGDGFGDLFRQAQELQEQLLAAQERATEQEVDGQSGGGAVRVTITGGLDVRRVRIDPSAVDPDDISMLEDLVTAAVRDALDRVREVAEQAVGGLDVSSLLGGAFGGGPGGPGGVGSFGDAGDLAGLAGGPEALPGGGFQEDALPERDDEAGGGPSPAPGGGPGGRPGGGGPGGDAPGGPGRGDTPA